MTNAAIIPHPALGGNSLPMLAEEIRSHHAVAERARTEGLESAIAAGKALREAKNLVIRTGGSWEIWIKDNCKFSKRTAQTYMQIARGGAPAAHLSLHSALKTRSEQLQPKAEQQSIERPKAKRHHHPPAESGKGRIKAKRRSPGSAPLKQDFFPNVPQYLEEMLLTMERCVIEYEMPTIEETAKAVIANRLKLEHFDEIISWLTRLRSEVHSRREEENAATHPDPERRS
jgi:Protein of unknown function (DUF3102)